MSVSKLAMSKGFQTPQSASLGTEFSQHWVLWKNPILKFSLESELSRVKAGFQIARRAPDNYLAPLSRCTINALEMLTAHHCLCQFCSWRLG